MIDYTKLVIEKKLGLAKKLTVEEKTLLLSEQAME